MAEKSMAPGDLSKALGALANIQGARSQFRERVETALRRLELSQEAGFSDAFEKTVILEEAGEALVYVGEYEQALMYLHQAESLANQIQSIRLITAALRYQAQCYFYLDRWDDVLTTEERRNTIERQYADLGAGLMRHTNQFGPRSFAHTGMTGALLVGARVRAGDRWFIAPEVGGGLEAHTRLGVDIGVMR